MSCCIFLTELHGFPKPRHCTKKTDKFHNANKWNTTYCLDLFHDKELCQLRFSRHGHPFHNRSYSDDTLVKELFQSAAKIVCLGTSEDRLVFILAFDEYRTQCVYIFKPGEQTREVFFLCRTGNIVCHQCVISPDGTRVSLTISEQVSSISGPDTSSMVRYAVQIYSKRPAAYEEGFQGNMFEIEHELPDVYGCLDVPKVMFDPRYHSSRLALVAIKSIQDTEICYYFTNYDLYQKVVQLSEKDSCPEHCQMFELLDAAYTPDGSMVLATVLAVPSSETKQMKVIRAVLAFNSNTLELIHTIKIGHENIDECYVNFRPNFSTNKYVMALRQRKTVKVYQLPIHLTLQNLCRIALLNHDSQGYSRPDISPSISNFLQYKPYL